VRTLGGGGMKTVYLAEDQRLAHRPCALAEMIDGFSDPQLRSKAADAFRREAEMLATLRHEHIPQIYDSFTEGQRHFLVMEYIDGGTLEARQECAPSATETRLVVDMALGILDALEYLHTRNPPVVYRDLKPSNVMITNNGVVKLIDFGIARHFQPDETATMVGTHGYAPPEQYRGKIEPRSDIYALGALMHYLLSGRDPSKEAPFSFPPLEQLRPDLRPALSALINEALAYDPGARVGSASEFKRRLLAVFPGIAHEAAAVTSTNDVTVRLSGRSRRTFWSRKLVAGLLVATVTLGVAAAYVYLTPPIQERLGIEAWLKPKSLLEAEGQVDRARRQIRLGTTPTHIEQPDSQSLGILIRSAERGRSDDQFRLGFVYEHGFGTKVNNGDALQWFRRAAEQGDADGEVSLGFMYDDGGQGVEKDPNEALKWFRKAAQHGDADGELKLGLMYETGAGAPRDDDEAVKWFRKAADQGSADGEVQLGIMYENGAGALKDYEKALKWYRKAADQGNALGELYLGIMYRSGEGVRKDYDKALKWFRKAADQGDALGELYLGIMYHNGEGIPADYDEAVKWFRKAADQGDATGEVDLGLMYDNGEGVEKDPEEAVKWYRKAADQGDADGEVNLGLMYESGKGVEKDADQAFRWFHEAAEQGDSYGEVFSGLMYWDGKGVAQSCDEALKWLRKAADQGVNVSATIRAVEISCRK